MIPEAGGDIAAAVVAVLGITVLGIATAMSASAFQYRRALATLLSASGLSLATILFIWAVARGAGFIRL